jgi:transcriptional regulator with XRE-family HTH domain
MTTNKRELSATERLEKKFGRLTFASALKSWRLGDEYTQTEFAKKLGISVQNLNDLEKGRRIPSPARAAKIAQKLKLPEKAFIMLAIRDALYKDGFHFNVSLETA